MTVICSAAVQPTNACSEYQSTITLTLGPYLGAVSAFANFEDLVTSNTSDYRTIANTHDTASLIDYSQKLGECRRPILGSDRDAPHSRRLMQGPAVVLPA